jgi:choice-of-anchor A domain-containing protein/uncharacterized repeat protein (TIGR01451 family)
MKKMLSVMLLFLATLTLLAQSYPVIYKNPNAPLGSTTAKVTGTHKGTNVTLHDPYLNQQKTYFAGTLSGMVDAQGARFYCIDLRKLIAFYSTSNPHTYTDEGNTPSQITFILNNYFPFKVYPYSGSLSTEDKEAAAVQLAIWYFSDGVNLATVTNSELRNRAEAIVTAANNITNLASTPLNLLITPEFQSIMTGQQGKFRVEAFDQAFNKMGGITASVTTTSGTLSQSSVVTTSNGNPVTISLTQGASNSALLTATANVTIPQGTRYVHSVSPDGHQKLVLATPSLTSLTANGEVSWYPNPGPCNLNGFVTFTQGGWQSPGNSNPGYIRDTYFNTVFPTGATIGKNTKKATFTTTTAIRNFLQNVGGTHGTLTGVTVNPTTSTGGTLATQTPALTLNVYYDSARVTGTNPQKLGKLIFVSGPFAGKSVYELLDIANSALGGLTVPYTFSQINDAATQVNENFVEGKVNKGALTCGPSYASIGDRVWNDFNKNGIQDMGEQGVPGVVVKLYTCLNTLIATTTTDATGNYYFGNLTPGDYYVQFVLPEGLAFTNRNQGGFIDKDSDADPVTGKTFCTTLSPGEDDFTWDAGVYMVMNCATSWTGTLGNNEEVCFYTPQTVTANGSVSLTPGQSRAILQTAWKINSSSVSGSSFTYSTKEIFQDTTFSISAQWPGINSNDTYVEVIFLAQVLNCDGMPMGNPITKKFFWNPVNCPPPPPNQADIQITKTSNNASVNNGDNVQYVITVTNNGPQNATGVVVSDLLPSSVEYLNSVASKGSYDPVSGLWTIGDLTNGENVTLTVNVKINLPNTGNGTGVFDLGPATGYNLFVLYDLTQPSSDTEGKVAVGRDATLSNYSIGDKLEPAPFGTRDVFVVGRNLTFTSGAVSGGNVVYGNSTNLPIYPVSILDGNLRQDSPIDFLAAEGYLLNLSSTLGNYSVNGTTTYQWGGIFLNGTNPVLNVFFVSGAQINGANNFVIDVPNGSAVLVNIDGHTITWSGGLSVLNTNIGNVVYNFSEATSITLQYINITGTILAPKADVNFVSGVQNGQMICKSMSGMGQFNYVLFIGNIPVDETVVNIATIIASHPYDPNSSNNSSQVAVNVGGLQQLGTPGDGGEWSLVGRPDNNSVIMSMELDANGDLLTGTLGGALYRSVNNNWVHINEGMNNIYVWSVVNAGNNLVMATEKGVYVSTDNGSNWINSDLMNKEIRTIIRSGNTLYAGTWGFGVYSSNDNGLTWNVANGGLTSPNIHTLTKSSNGTLFAGSFDGGLFRSLDGGANWVKLNVGYDLIWSVGVTSDNIVFAGTYGNGLFRSTDNGNNWIRMNIELNAQFIYSIKVDANDKIYISTWAGGLFTSKDKGLTFTSGGMNGYEVSALLSNTSGSRFFVGTGKGSIYTTSSTTSTEDVTNIPSEFSLSQNYPNPFNPATKIEFAVAKSEHVSIVVYNMLGQEIRTLINQELSPGRYNVSFDGSGLASGMYIYQFKSASASFVKKMMMIK